MSAEAPSANAGAGGQPEWVQAACGSLVRLSDSLPRTEFGGSLLYFCLPSCLEVFEEEPERSCLKHRLKRRR